MKQGCRLGCLGNMPITSDYTSTREGRQVVRLNRIFSEHVLTPAAIPAVHVLFLLFLFTRENGSGSSNSSNSMQFQDSRARIASQLKEHRRYKLYPSMSRCLVAEPPRFKKGNTWSSSCYFHRGQPAWAFAVNHPARKESRAEGPYSCRQFPTKLRCLSMAQHMGTCQLISIRKLNYALCTPWDMFGNVPDVVQQQ